MLELWKAYRVILSAGAMLIFSVSFQIDQMPEGESLARLLNIYNGGPANPHHHKCQCGRSAAGLMAPAHRAYRLRPQPATQTQRPPSFVVPAGSAMHQHRSNVPCLSALVRYCHGFHPGVVVASGRSGSFFASFRGARSSESVSPTPEIDTAVARRWHSRSNKRC
ncbi:hypothetical protein BC567DRAFT_229956 [Phyllosticta citribraziliensis]